MPARTPPTTTCTTCEAGYWQHAGPSALVGEAHNTGETCNTQGVCSLRIGPDLSCRYATSQKPSTAECNALRFIAPWVAPSVPDRYLLCTDAEGFRNAQVRPRIHVAALADSFTDALTLPSIRSGAHAWNARLTPRLLRFALMPPYLNTLRFSQAELEKRSGWQSTRTTILEMKRVSDENGATLVVLFIPFKSQVYLSPPMALLTGSCRCRFDRNSCRRPVFRYLH